MLSVDLQLHDRCDDRVIVSIRLEPIEGAQRVDGVVLELRDENGDSLGPRMLLPVSGTLGGPLVTRAELHARRAIPRDSRVVAVAWWGCEQVQATCPCDHGTTFQAHVLGRRCVVPRDDDDDLAELLPEERAALLRALPWLGEPCRCATEASAIPVDPVEPAPPRVDPVEQVTDEIVECLGLDGDNARWLKELLESEDL